MESSTPIKRQITKKCKLAKIIREIYKHRNLNFFPPHYKFSKPLLILSKEVLTTFSSVLLSSHVDFIACSCIMEEGDEERLLKLNKKIILFKDEFVAELDDNLADFDVQSEIFNIKRLISIKEHLRMNYPQGTFDILTLDNILQYFGGRPVSDVVLRPKLPGSDQAVFEPYIENPDFVHRTGNITKGTLMINPLNNLEGEVVEKEKRTKVRGKNINRAMHGDEVFLEDDRIVGIAKGKLRIVAGTLFHLEEIQDGVRMGLVKPVDKRLPDIRTFTSFNISDKYKKVVIHILEWDYSEENPYGVIIDVIGVNGNFEDEISAIYKNAQIDYFHDSWLDVCNRRREEIGELLHPGTSSSLENTASELGFDEDHFSVERAIKEITTGKRRDLRNLDVVSIDPPGCTDIDDALHCIVCDDCIEIGVHIADVSFYVLPDTILDIEAKYRSTTVYFPEKRVDMLPPFISSNLCSLLEGEDRAAFSCIWKLDKNFNIISTDLCRSVIKSRAALSYEEAYSIIKSEEGNDVLRLPLIYLLQIATALRRRRFDKGALELSLQELNITLEGKLAIKKSVPTHYLVEEFMLLANITVAKFIYKGNPEYSLLRKHPLPSPIELDIVDATSSKTLNDSLKKLNEEQAMIIKRIITRSMQQALYFCSGESSDFYHYGLATEIYTHFTSPIRRYPDIIVHRTLSYILEGDEAMIDGLKAVVNKNACFMMNFRHRNAQNASRLAKELYIVRILEDENLEAHVVSITGSGIVVFIPAYDIEGFVETLDQYSLFDMLVVKIERNFSEYCLRRSLSISIVK